MSCIFIIATKQKFQVFRRTERYQNERIRIKCEDEYYMNHDDYHQMAQLLAAEIKDELNMNDFTKHTVLFIYDRMKTADTLNFISAFKDAKHFQQMTLGNALTLIAITMKLYETGKKLYIAFEQNKYAIESNQFRYFETKASSAAPIHQLDADELIRYLSGICAE